MINDYLAPCDQYMMRMVMRMDEGVVINEKFADDTLFRERFADVFRLNKAHLAARCRIGEMEKVTTIPRYVLEYYNSNLLKIFAGMEINPNDHELMLSCYDYIACNVAHTSRASEIITTKKAARSMARYNRIDDLKKIDQRIDIIYDVHMGAAQGGHKDLLVPALLACATANASAIKKATRAGQYEMVLYLLKFNVDRYHCRMEDIVVGGNVQLFKHLYNDYLRPRHLGDPIIDMVHYLISTVDYGHLDLLSYLYKHFAQYQYISNTCKEEYVNMAIEHGDIKMLHFLAENMDAIQTYGPHLKAVIRGRLSMLKYLISVKPYAELITVFAKEVDQYPGIYDYLISNY